MGAGYSRIAIERIPSADSTTMAKPYEAGADTLEEQRARYDLTLMPQLLYVLRHLPLRNVNPEIIFVP